MKIFIGISKIPSKKITAEIYYLVYASVSYKDFICDRDHNLAAS